MLMNQSESPINTKMAYGLAHQRRAACEGINTGEGVRYSAGTKKPSRYQSHTSHDQGSQFVKLVHVRVRTLSGFVPVLSSVPTDAAGSPPILANFPRLYFASTGNPGARPTAEIFPSRTDSTKPIYFRFSDQSFVTKARSSPDA